MKIFAIIIIRIMKIWMKMICEQVVHQHDIKKKIG